MGQPMGDRTYDGLPLAYRRIADELPHNSLTLAYLKQAQPPAKLQALMDFCRDEFVASDGQLAQWKSR